MWTLLTYGNVCLGKKKKNVKQYVHTDSCVNALWSAQVRDQKGICSAVDTPVHHFLLRYFSVNT